MAKLLRIHLPRTRVNSVRFSRRANGTHMDYYKRMERYYELRAAEYDDAYLGKASTRMGGKIR